MSPSTLCRDYGSVFIAVWLRASTLAGLDSGKAQLDALLHAQEDAGQPVAGSWFNATFLSRPGCIFVAHSAGTLATIDINSSGTVVELVGELDGGILAAAWTSDESLLAVATGAARSSS